MLIRDRYPALVEKGGMCQEYLTANKDGGWQEVVNVTQKMDFKTQIVRFRQ